MKIGVIGESICDTDSTKYILQEILGNISIVSTATRGPVVNNKLASRIFTLINSHSDLSAVVILHDLDNKNCNDELTKVRTKVGSNVSVPIIIQIVIQEIEAWYLAMPDCIEKAFPNLSPFSSPTGNTDNIVDPKAELNKKFRKIYKRSYRETTDGPKIALEFQYDVGKTYQNQSFNRFISKLQQI